MPPLQPPHLLPRHHLHLPRKTTSLPDVIFAAFSRLVLFSTSPESTSLSPLPTSKKLYFPSYPRKFPKMSSPFTNPRKFDRRPPPPFATPQSLSDWLKSRLDSDCFDSWGVKPGTKNVHNLWLEVVEGESSLTDSMPPVRSVEVVIVRIIRNDGEKKILVESHQELSNGDVRYRSRPLSEKMKPGESVEAAVFRAVKEELGSLVKTKTLDKFDHKIVRILPGTYVKKVEERTSASYPGLPACYVLHTVDAEIEGLPENEFCTEEMDEYEVSDERNTADCAVLCRKHYWKWVVSDSI